MTGASKILTVSYGTFSCTLEGFDDPFSTMRHIAEYFRDLAAEDRYFGCEPPVPDAAMLQRIAENSGRKRVATEMQDGALVLRQSPDDLTAAPDSTEPAPEPEEPRPTRFGVVDGAGSVSEKIERIRRVSEGRDWPGSGQIRALFPEGEDSAEDAADTQAESAAEAPTPVEEPALGQFPHDETGIAEATLPDIAADAEAPVDGVAPLPESAAPEEVLPAVSEETTRALAAEPELPENEGNTAPHAPTETVTEPEEGAQDAEADAATTAPAEAAQAEEAPGALTEADPWDISAPQEDASAGTGLTEPREATPEEAEVTQQDAAAAQDAAPAETTPAEAAHAEQDHKAAGTQETEPEPDLAAETAGDTTEAPHAQLSEAEPAATEPAPAQDDTASTDKAEQTRRMARRARARLAKISQQQTTPATATQDAAPDPATEFAETTGTDAPDPAAERDLEAELAAIQSDEDAAEDALRAALDTSRPFGDDTPTGADAPTATEAPANTPEVPAGSTASGPAEPAPDPFGTVDSASDGPALERLMQTADSKLSGSEQVRKLNAFQQLKAAVAATFADRQSSGSEPAVAPAPRERSEAYRTDLREVTQTRQSRRPETGGGFAANTPRPAPLVLVSEQRVDRSARRPGTTTEEGRVRPRRVLRDNTEAAGRRIGDQLPREGDSFRDFAKRIGANGLPDLLEAAAAYTAHIEGRSRFSRAQVMSKLAEIDSPDGAAFSREEGLRSFGKLLRQGRIRRVQDGQFVIADTSRFLQEARTGTV